MNPRRLHHEGHEDHEGFAGHLTSLLFVFFVLFVVNLPARGAEPFLKKGDVIALVGGEDMVVAGELGYLELLLTRALPGHRLRFRCLAWEGDTVFEQRRDLNFPPLEAQLDQVGATVVICQFGQMEALAAAQRNGTTKDTKSTKEQKEVRGKDASPPFVSSVPFVVQNPGAADSAVKDFIAAYEKLIERMRAGGKRRVVVLSPDSYESAQPQADFGEAVRAMRLQPGGLMDISPGRKPGVLGENAARPEGVPEAPEASAAPAGADALANVEPRVSPGADIREPSRLKTRKQAVSYLRDGVHLSYMGQLSLAWRAEKLLHPSRVAEGIGLSTVDGQIYDRSREALLALIRAKNRLWFDYWRVQNWAFLAGDRTEQPSSRDHLDRAKRWFPAEREAFLPLIAAKEREIDALAAQLAKP